MDERINMKKEEDFLEDIEIEDIEAEDALFDDEDFEVKDHNGHKVRKGKKRQYSHLVVIGIAVAIILAVSIRVAIWNRGTQSDYDPTEDTSQFDVEPTDFIQPLTSKQLEGKVKDDVLTLVTIGNSPFADNYGNNNLAKAIQDVFDANVINIGFEESFITQKNREYNIDTPEDGVSLPQVINALATGDVSVVKDAAGRISDQNVMAAKALENIDMSKVDGVIIMYNLEDYADHRPLGSEDIDDVTSIYGAMYGSIKQLQETYPYVRIVVLSVPAAGVTIDDFYVDGDLYDIGCGTLSEYAVFETEATVTRGASFVDVYYGAINVDQREEYLYDDYHISDAGAKSIANRVNELILFQD